MLKFKRTDLSSEIYAEVAEAQKKADANPDGVYSGVTNALQAKVDAIEARIGPAAGG